MTDSKELIERLQDYVVNDPYTTELCREAASALESLSAENAELREALKPFAEIAKELGDGIPDDGKNTWDWAVPYAGDLRHARAKLEGSGA